MRDLFPWRRLSVRRSRRSAPCACAARTARLAAVTVTYRLAPKHPLPAAFEDAKSAVRFVRAKAKELKVDPQRVASLGASAGGVIALMVGLTKPSDGFEGGDQAEQSSAVQAVVNFFGPTDFTTLQPTVEGERQIREAYGKDFPQMMADALGSSDRRDKNYRRMSPHTYVRKGAPPVLTLHGAADPLVGLDQPRSLHAALKKAGVAEQLVIAEQGGHGWGGEELDRTNRALIDFLSERFLSSQSTVGKDGKARAVAEQFAEAFLAKDADGVLKLARRRSLCPKKGS